MATLPLTTLARVQKNQRITAGTAPDEFITEQIPILSAAFERYCKRAFHVEERTEIFEPDNQRTIYPLKGYPVTTLAEVKNAGAVLTVSEYLLNHRKDAVRFDDAPAFSRDGFLEIKYTGGLAIDEAALVAATQFLDLVGACERQVAHFWHTRDRLGQRGSISVGGASVTFEAPDLWLRDVVKVLDRYVRG